MNALAAALAEAHKELKNPGKDRENYFNSRYATLDALQDASRTILAKHGLTVTQVCQPADSGELKSTLVTTEETDQHGKVTKSQGFKLEPFRWQLRTVLMHTSGTTIESIMPLVMVTKGAQQFGSEITYMRRYAYAAILNMTADEDDDANAAQGLKENHKATAAAPRKPVSPKKQWSPERDRPQPVSNDILDAEGMPPADYQGPVDTDTGPDEIPGLGEAPEAPAEELTLLEQVQARLKNAKRTERDLMAQLWSYKLTKVPELRLVDDKVLSTVLEGWDRVLKRMEAPVK